MTTALRKPRPRRIAADEAHSWARNLRLGNPYAKLVLSMLTIYVNGEGSCFVSAAALAEDCELALETVRRRLAWLEGIGAIARFPQWLDEHGRRNGDGNGRRTTDDIRLLINADPEQIEAKAAGGEGDIPEPCETSTSEISPLREGGTNSDGETVSPLAAPSLRRGPDSLEPEPKDSPQPPFGGLPADQVEIEGWIEFKSEFEADGEPIGRVSLAKQLLGALNSTERQRCTKAASGLIAWRRRQKKPPTKLSAQTFIREIDGWASWEQHAPPPAAPPPPPPRWIGEGSTEFRARQVLDVLRGDPPRQAQTCAGLDGKGCKTSSREPSLDLLALAQFDPFEKSGWIELGHEVDVDRKKLGAWRERVKEWSGDDLKITKFETGEFTEALGRRYPKMRAVSYVPCEWPPRKDGSLCTTDPPNTS